MLFHFKNHYVFLAHLYSTKEKHLNFYHSNIYNRWTKQVDAAAMLYIGIQEAPSLNLSHVTSCPDRDFL